MVNLLAFHKQLVWRDVYQSATTNFIAVFSTLENKEVLDTLKKVDMYCLDYVLSSMDVQVSQ